jgi:hypothetical protein
MERKASLLRKIQEFNNGKNGSAVVVFYYKGKLTCCGDKDLMKRAGSDPLFVEPPDARESSAVSTSSPDWSSSFVVDGTKTPSLTSDAGTPRQDDGTYKEGALHQKFTDLGLLLKNLF